MNNFFSKELPPSFYVHASSQKSKAFAHINKSYCFTNWLSINENVDLRDFQVGLVEIQYGDSFIVAGPSELQMTTRPPPTRQPLRTTTERQGLLSALSTLLTASKLNIILEKKSGIQVLISKEPRQQMREFLLALVGRVDTDIPGLTIQFYNNADGSQNTQLDFTDALSEGYNVHLDEELATVMGFRDTIFAPGSYRSPGIQSNAAFDKIKENTSMKIQRFKWTQFKIPISIRAEELDEEDEESALSAWLGICGESLVAGGYDVSFVFDPNNEHVLNVVLEQDAVDFRFRLPEQINRLMNLRAEYMFQQSTRINLPVYKKANQEEEEQIVQSTLDSKVKSGYLPLIYVTCDLVEVSQLGEGLHQLLRVFPRQEGISATPHKLFPSVYYQTLISGHPRSICIQLFNQKWEHLPDSNTETVAVLHFRRA